MEQLQDIWLQFTALVEAHKPLSVWLIQALLVSIWLSGAVYFFFFMRRRGSGVWYTLGILALSVFGPFALFAGWNMVRETKTDEAERKNFLGRRSSRELGRLTDDF